MGLAQGGLPALPHIGLFSGGPGAVRRVRLQVCRELVAACGTVHPIKAKTAPFTVTIPQCRQCGRSSLAPAPLRNWSVMLIGQAIVEVAAEVLRSGPGISVVERRAVRDTLCNFPDLSAQVVDLLLMYFDQCVRGEATDALAGCIAHCKRQFRTRALRIGVAVAEADGPITTPRWQALLRLAAKLGLDPETELRGKRPLEKLTPLIGDETWWDILQLPPRASVRDIKAAYRRQARKYHPDRLFNAPQQLREASAERMKFINRAFADALSAADETATRPSDVPAATATVVPADTKYYASRWRAVAARPPYAVGSVSIGRRTKQFWRRAAVLSLLAVIAWFWFGFVTSTNPYDPPWWNDPVLSGCVAVSAACFAAVVGALYGYGTRAAAWTLVLIGFAVAAGFWYRGLEKAIEFERKHPESLRYHELNGR